LTYNESIYGTNIQHGLMLARQFLNRHKTGNKQVIIVTDGEPTATWRGSKAVFFYPAAPGNLPEDAGSRCNAVPGAHRDQHLHARQ